MPLDLSWLSTGMPILGFVLVFVLIYAILAKVKIIGESKPINVILSLILSIIFISFSSIRSYITNLAPWFAVMLVLAFFFFMIVAFLVKDPASFTKVFAFVFIIAFALIAIVALFYTFSNTHAYLPYANENGANEFLLKIKHFLLGEQFLSGFLILIIAIIVIFIII